MTGRQLYAAIAPLSAFVAAAMPAVLIVPTVPAGVAVGPAAWADRRRSGDGSPEGGERG